MRASHLRIDASYFRWWQRLTCLAKTLMLHEPHRALKYSYIAADSMCDLIRSRHVDSLEIHRDFQTLCLEAFELEDSARAVLAALDSAPPTTSLPAPRASGFLPSAIPDSAPPAASQTALLAASEPATATPELAPAATSEPAPPAILEPAAPTAYEAAIATPELAPLVTFEPAPSASAEPAPLEATAIVTLSPAVSSAPAAIIPYASPFIRGEKGTIPSCSWPRASPQSVSCMTPLYPYSM